MNKEIKVSLKFENDNATFDGSVSKIRKSLQEVASSFKTAMAGAFGGGAGGSNAGMEAFLKSMDAMRKKMDTTMREHKKEQVSLMKQIIKEEERRNKLLQDQEKFSKGKTKDLQEELRIKKELKNVEEQIAKNYAAGAAVSAKMGGGGGGGGGRGGGGAAGGKGFFSGLGKTIGGAAALLATGATLIDQYTSLPLTRTAALGNVTQSLLGSNLQDIANGNVISSMAWMKEKQRASEMAQARLQSQMVTGPMNLLSGAVGVAKGVFTGQGVGQDSNANLLMGTVTKAMEKVFDVGGLVPNRLSKSLGAASEEYFSTHQAQLMEDFGKNYENMLEAQRKQNPLKNLAVNYFQDRYKTDLQAQRMMGITDEQFYGRKGFMEQANMGGFTGDMAMQMAQQIQGAGGSTRGMRGNALLGLRAGRGFDLTNASSILGTISGGAGSAEASERIFKKILEDGVKNGLDKSEAVEELRRFSQQTAEIVSKTGATNIQDAQRIIEGFSRFQAGGIPTTREQEGARAAYQEYQGFTSQTGGRGGAMQYAALTKSGLAGRLNPREIGSIMEMPEEDVTTGNPFIQAMASRAGMRPEELVRQIINSKRQGVAGAGGFNPEWQKTLSRAGITKELSFDELEKLKSTDKDAWEAYMQTEAAQSNISTYGGVQKRSAGVRGLMTMGELGPGGPVSRPETADEVERRLKEAPGTRAADEVIKSTGVAAQAMLENFRDFKKEITPAAEALDIFTKRLIILTQVMQMTPERDRAATAKYVGEHLAAPIQPQGGKAKPGGQ